MIRISPTAIKCRAQTSGFTLLEMLVVLAIMSLLIGLASSVASQNPHRFETRRTVAEVAGMMRTARMEALQSGRLKTVRAADLPNDSVSLIGNGAPLPAITWYGDGSSSGGAVVQGTKVLLRVDSLTGVIREAR